MNYLRWLSGETQTWSGAVKDHKLAFEEYDPIDRKANPCIGLDTTEAHRGACRGIVNIFTRDNCIVGANAEGEVGKSG